MDGPCFGGWPGRSLRRLAAMRATTVLVVLASGLALAGCGAPVSAASPTTTPAAQVVEGASTSKVHAGEEYTYPDGLVVTVGRWREEQGVGPDGSTAVAVDVTARNPTDRVLRTTRAGVNVRAGGGEEQLREWPVGDPLDAVLEPGGEATATYYYDMPTGSPSLSASLEWLHAPDPQTRPVVHVLLTP